MTPTRTTRVPTKREAALIRGMIARGDLQEHISAYLGLNIGRISEVNTGKRHPGVPAADPAELPPAGPYHVEAAE